MSNIPMVSSQPVSSAPSPAPRQVPDTLPPKTHSLPELTAEIQRCHSEVMNALGRGASAAIAAGEALKSAKEKLRKEGGHGNWQDYVTVECRLRPRTAQIYMLLARNKDSLTQLLAAKAQTNSFLTQGEALNFLGVAKKKRKRVQKAKPTANV